MKAISGSWRESLNGTNKERYEERKKPNEQRKKD
jgi:hypothetical protein